MVNRIEQASGLESRRSAIGLSAFSRAPISISDSELWPDLEPEDFELGELSIEDADHDEYEHDAFWALFDELWTDGLLVPLEQCCDEGVILPLELRAARLSRFPPDVGARLEIRMRRIPPALPALIAKHVYWTLRCSRARRTGSPELIANGSAR